ncbi:MAG: leucine--tRNA ligase [Thaumarchaeota archaeon]|nr:leucine--tRNA ligase [Candidatus Calditenuaceae archaeon]MDW8186597.1 leucine--tRNA ligase [Nitrososphaerota archaeon]
MESPVDYERYWAKRYEEEGVFNADPDPSRPKVFITFPYSYQSGPLHVGHCFASSRADAYARYKRLKGYNVLFPWAWHWTGEAVAGISDRLKKGDPVVMRVLAEVDGVPVETLKKFVDPVEVCRYYTEENRRTVKALGLSLDWRREFYTTDLHPYYSKFVEWQYLTLRELGHVRRGSHPVVWCPSCQSPTGDHDRLTGEGVSPTEFTMVFFDTGDAYLAAATLRPETIFGTTNVWVKPDATYAIVEALGVKLIVSDRTIAKLVEQVDGVRELGRLSGRDLIGKRVRVPLLERDVIVLPAAFVNPEIGTGVVYSVPAHAPYDYAALRDLKRNLSALEEYGLDPTLLAEIEPISIVRTEGMSVAPAVELVESEGITDQRDHRLEDLTTRIYTEEFYKGVMLNNCGEVSGMPVSAARDFIKSKLIESGKGLRFYDLTEKVVCRSGDECIVKVVKDQWFLAYSDEEWKKRVRSHVRSMYFSPEGVRQWVLNVVDWLRDWPCARKTGLGTKLPFDPNWIVETLSDSTIYQALYTISHYLNSRLVKPEQLTKEVLDLIFRGVGDPIAISESTGLDPKILMEMRHEHDYWYPVDLRVSGKDLVPNHLTFFIYHHVALFRSEKWPRGIAVNGMVRVEGQEMHKSKGNFIPIKAAIARYGADATRLNLLLAAEDMDDPDWRERGAADVRRALDHLLGIAREVAEAQIDPNTTRVDRWLLARLRSHLSTIEEAMELMKTRTAANTALYLMLNDWRRYVRRRGGGYGPAARTFVNAWTKALSLFAPFTAEEMNRVLGNRGFVALSSWPVVEVEYGVESLLEEELIDQLIDDIRNIAKLLNTKGRLVRVLVAPAAFLPIFSAVLKELSSEGRVDVRTYLEDFTRSGIVDRGAAAGLVTRFVNSVQQLLNRYPVNVVDSVMRSEKSLYIEEVNYLSSELGIEIEVQEADYLNPDAKRKSLQAVPLRPGIIL